MYYYIKEFFNRTKTENYFQLNLYDLKIISSKEKLKEKTEWINKNQYTILTEISDEIQIPERKRKRNRK